MSCLQPQMQAFSSSITFLRSFIHSDLSDNPVLKFSSSMCMQLCCWRIAGSVYAWHFCQAPLSSKKPTWPVSQSFDHECTNLSFAVESDIAGTIAPAAGLRHGSSKWCTSQCLCLWYLASPAMSLSAITRILSVTPGASVSLDFGQCCSLAHICITVICFLYGSTHPIIVYTCIL